MQRNGRPTGFGGSKGQAAPAVRVVGVNLRGFVEGGKGFAVLELAGQVLAVADQQIRVVGGDLEQAYIEVIGADRVPGVSKYVSQDAVDGCVLRIGVVELFEQRERFGLYPARPARRPVAR